MTGYVQTDPILTSAFVTNSGWGLVVRLRTTVTTCLAKTKEYAQILIPRTIVYVLNNGGAEIALFIITVSIILVQTVQHV